MQDATRAVVIGAGVGGLAAAVELVAMGLEVEVFERAPVAGGKVARVQLGDQAVDVGPTVLTMRWVFDALCRRLGVSLDEALGLEPLERLARYAWADGSQLDLYSDVGRSRDAIAAFAGHEAAVGFERFLDDSRLIYETIQGPFLEQPEPRFGQIGRAWLRGGPRSMAAIDPMRSMASSLRRYFDDPRLLDVFGHYAARAGSSPWQTPATLNLMAHVEHQGAWHVPGGMGRLVDLLVSLLTRRGGRLHTGCDVERVLTHRGRATGVRLRDGRELAADLVIVNADAAAVAEGLLGDDIARVGHAPAPTARSLSALVWAGLARTDAPLTHQTICFGDDPKTELDGLFEGGAPATRPTVTLLSTAPPKHGATPVVLRVQAAADGDRHRWSSAEIARVRADALAQLARCGLTLELDEASVTATSPTDFAARYPGTGGALYGRAGHGMLSIKKRPGICTRVDGLYLVGGSVHPGAGLPMVALGGRLAVEAIAADLRLPALAAAS